MKKETPSIFHRFKEHFLLIFRIPILFLIVAIFQAVCLPIFIRKKEFANICSSVQKAWTSIICHNFFRIFRLQVANHVERMNLEVRFLGAVIGRGGRKIEDLGRKHKCVLTLLRDEETKEFCPLEIMSPEGDVSACFDVMGDIDKLVRWHKICCLIFWFGDFACLKFFFWE